MKIIILLSYLIVSYLLIPYLFSFVGALKKVGTMSQDEFNEEEEEKHQLNAKETVQAQQLASLVFVLVGMCLYVFLGVTFGLATQELIGDSVFKWVVYPLLYIMMVSSFSVGRKVVEKTYATKLSITERVVFYLTMLVAYLMAIWAKSSLPFVLTWHWMY